MADVAGYVPMEKGETGCHHAAAKERFVVSTGRPIQPHQPLPTDYVLPANHKKWKWHPLLAAVADVLGLLEGAAHPDVASKLWSKAEVTGKDLEDGEVEADFAPDPAGYEVTLKDFVKTRVRFRKNPDLASGYEAEWLISNRDFPIPAQHEFSVCIGRV